MNSPRGFAVFFTGLSGAGKTTVAEALGKRLEAAGRTVTQLDGDVVRTHLTKGLGFSKEDRATNVRRVGWVAAEIARHGGAVLCALIAPYEEDRQANRSLISKAGTYVEVHVSTPIETCEKRDVKGMYAKARRGEIKGFTGVDDPYEAPLNPEIRLDTSTISVDKSVETILSFLKSRGCL